MTRKTPARRSRLGIPAVFGLMACNPAAAAPLSDAAIRAKVAEGVSMATNLRLAINRAYLKNGPGDMTCEDKASCAKLGTVYTPANPVVLSIRSLQNGEIWITYNPFNSSLLPAGANNLALIPVNSRTGKRLDLMLHPRAPYVWDCGAGSTIVGFKNPETLSTTILQKYLPADCK